MSTTVNGPHFTESLNGVNVRSISDAGQKVYWIVFGCMAGSAFIFAILTFLKPVQDRSHGYVTLLIVTAASCAYYAMATTGGQTAISQEDQFQDAAHTIPTLRSVYWARYVDWFVTTPLLLLDLLLIAAAPFGTCLWIIACDIFMIITGLFGALCSHKFKWGWYGAGCLFQILLVYGMVVTGTGHARRRGAVTGNKKLGLVYLVLTSYLLMIWWGYPIVWGFCEGANFSSVTLEAAAYGGLDVAAKVIFGFMVFAVYPLLTAQNKDEYRRGHYLPTLLAAPINGILYPPTIPLAEHQALYNQNKGKAVTGAQRANGATYPSGAAGLAEPNGSSAVPHAGTLNNSTGVQGSHVTHNQP